MTTASVLLTYGNWNSSDNLLKNNKSPAVRNVSAIAARELRESPATREQALRLMRDWIRKNDDIKNVRQDDSFLLRFLRHKKFSVPMAQQTLLKYLNLRKVYPEVFHNLDYELNLQEIIDNGYIVVSPVRDHNGRRVIIYNIAKLDAKKFSCWDMCRAHTVVYESLLEEGAEQVCGFTHVGDGHGVTAAHITAWNPSDFARVIKWGEQSLPIRHKEIHLLNISSAIKYIIDFAVTRASPKMSQRLHLHQNLTDIHKTLDKSCLPTNYGGPIPLQDMITYTKQLLGDQRERILANEDMQILSTRGIITSKNNTKQDMNSVVGSFRKLDID